MADRRKKPDPVSSDHFETGDTQAPDDADGGMLAAGTGDQSPQSTSTLWSKSFPELLDKTLHTGTFYNPKFLIRLIVIGWLVVSGFIVVSDQLEGKLTNIDEVCFTLIKSGVVAGLCIVAALLVWLLREK